MAGRRYVSRDLRHGLVALESGKDHLRAVDDNEARDLLDGIADYLIEREY